jgi:WD40 repeat protein
MILSASSDKTVKLWDLRKTDQAVSSLTTSNPIEDFCMSASSLYLAHGNVITATTPELSTQNDFFAF